MSQDNGHYGSDFYRSQMEGSYRSATIVLQALLQHVMPKSAVDFGCGVGSWLKACMDLGIGDVRGLDGQYVDRSLLRIPSDRFQSRNLESDSLDLDRRFDLAICLEVAEHLTAKRSGELVAALCKASDTVLFAAAVPGQRGTFHINEQFPSYWIPIFARNGYSCHDFLRWQLWSDARIEVWYRQNIFVFSRSGDLPARVDDAAACDVIHPQMWLEAANVKTGLDRMLAVGRTELAWMLPESLKAFFRSRRA